MDIPIEWIQIPERDTQRWFKFHTIDSPYVGCVRIPTPCVKLTNDGLCGIYEDRPEVCRLFVVGSDLCIDAVRRHRTPEQYILIRDSNDPTVEEVYG